VTIGRQTIGRVHLRRRPRANPETSLLSTLRAELQRARVKAEPGPDGTALLVYRADATLPVWVFVGHGGTSFAWESGRRHHPVTDIPGAAVELTAYVGCEAR
jgi:hypothetical protein